MNKLIKIIKKIDDIFGKISRAIIAISIAIQISALFIGVIFRYFLDNPISWIDEVSMHLLIFVTYFGCYVALQENQLARISLFTDKLPKNIKKYVVLIANIFVIILLVAIVYYGTKMSLSPVVLKQVTSATQTPMIIFYSAIPFTCLLMMINILIKVYDTIQEDIK